LGVTYTRPGHSWVSPPPPCPTSWSCGATHTGGLTLRVYSLARCHSTTCTRPTSALRHVLPGSNTRDKQGVPVGSRVRGARPRLSFLQFQSRRSLPLSKGFVQVACVGGVWVWMGRRGNENGRVESLDQKHKLRRGWRKAPFKGTHATFWPIEATTKKHSLTTINNSIDPKTLHVFLKTRFCSTLNALPSRSGHMNYNINPRTHTRLPLSHHPQYISTSPLHDNIYIYI